MTYRTFKKPVGKVPPIVMVAGIGALGFAIYQFWWLPKAQAALAARAARDPNQVRAAQALLQQAQDLQHKNPGMSLQTAFEKIGTIGCQVVAVKYGVKPQFSGGICALAVQLGIEATKLGYKYAKKGGRYVYKGASAVGNAPLAAARYAAKAAASAAEAAAKAAAAAAEAAASAAEDAAGAAASLVGDAASAVGSGLSKVGSGAKKIFCFGRWC